MKSGREAPLSRLCATRAAGPACARAVMPSDDTVGLLALCGGAACALWVAWRRATRPAIALMQYNVLYDSPNPGCIDVEGCLA